MDTTAFIVIVVTSAAIGIQLLRQRGDRLRPPLVTIGIAIVTFVVSVLAEFDPTLLAALARDRDALLAGEWWRMITPLFAQDGGWAGLIFNLVALLVLGSATELLLGRRMLLGTYFGAGLVSEVAAYTILQGQGFAGNSVANFGLAGLLAVVGVASSAAGPRLFGLVSLVAGALLLVFANLHGVGYAVGAVIGAIYVLVPRLKERARMSASRAAPGASGVSSAGS